MKRQGGLWKVPPCGKAFVLTDSGFPTGLGKPSGLHLSACGRPPPQVGPSGFPHFTQPLLLFIKGDISKKLKRGTFLKSLDNMITS